MGKGKPKVGRPKIVFTDDQMRQLETLAGYGMTLDQIAHVMDVGISILKDRPEFSAAIKKGRDKAIAKASQTAYQIAVKERHPIMLMFWLKTQAHWREKSEVDLNIHQKRIIIHNTADGTSETLTTEDQEPDENRNS